MAALNRQTIIALRLQQQGLITPYQDLADLLQASLGMQSQYINHALFNISTRLSKEAIKTFHPIENEAILAWGQRQTYHFYDKKSWQKITLALSQEALWPEKLLIEQGINLEQSSRKLEAFLSEARTRAQVLTHFKQDDKALFQWGALFLYHSRKGQLYHQWFLNQERNVVWEETNHSLYQLDTLKEELLRNYFHFYGPATLADAAHFFGVSKNNLSKIPLDSSLFQASFEGQSFFYKPPIEEPKIPKLVILGKFDPLLVSYSKKDVLIPKEKQALVWKKAGQISAISLKMVILLRHGHLKATLKKYNSRSMPSKN